MVEELVTQVRWPIADLESMTRKKYGLKAKLSDFRLEGDNVVLYFAGAAPLLPVQRSEPPSTPTKARRRRTGRRNRMKTRGWEVVARFTNSKGQQCSIYKPFVEALRNDKLSEKDRRAAVR